MKIILVYMYVCIFIYIKNVMFETPKGHTAYSMYLYSSILIAYPAARICGC